MLTLANAPYVFGRDEGPAFWSVGVLARVKATGEQTGGAFALVDELCPPGYATPLHVHHAEDEAFYVLEGTVTIFCDHERVEAGPGTFVFGPRNVPHGFRVEGEAPARVLILATPAGFDQFIIEMGEPVDTPALPDGSMDQEKLARVAARHRIEVLGPLPA